MVTITSFTQNVFVALAFALLAQGLTIPEGINKRTDKVVSLDFNVIRKPFDVADHSLSQKRDDDVLTTLINKGLYYASDIFVGSNKQKVTVLMDTGSSDLWVPDISVECQKTYDGQSNDFCKHQGTYDPSTSTTAHSLGEKYYIRYYDKTFSQGTYYNDTIGFSGISITGQQFGDVNITSVPKGIMGIGLASDVATSNKYDNVPVTLKKQGIINKNAYSLYLNSEDASTGTIIFGGVDNAKYTGTLTPLQSTSTNKFFVPLNSVNLNGTSVDTGAVSVLLDSGTTLTWLPQDIADELADIVGAKWDQSNNLYKLPSCDAPGDFVFNFPKGVQITVPLSEYVFHWDGQCFFGVSTNGHFVLGDNFLRRAYLLYDLEEITVSMAQVKYTTDEDIVAL